MSDRRHAASSAKPRPRSLWSLLVFGSAAVAILRFYDGPSSLVRPRPVLARAVAPLPFVTPAADAFGRSGDVRVRFVLPGDSVSYPLEVQGDFAALQYLWVRVSDSVGTDSVRALVGSRVVAPQEPGFYKLALVRANELQVVDGITIAVLVPFAEKLGSTLNGFRIGTYVAERLGGTRERPDGFVQVEQSDVDLPLSTHLRLSDFLTHDGQQTWPRYAALSGRLLDKLELVIAEIAHLRGDQDLRLTVEVHSGYRSPSYNRRVRRSARDSRHQYGDAADVTIDANGDGAITSVDTRLIAAAVETVEREHPDLAGGLGLYGERGQGKAYVHIDARGRRARWRG